MNEALRTKSNQRTIKTGLMSLTWSDIKQLSKPGLLLSVAVTSVIGMIFASDGQASLNEIFLLVIGIFLTGSGAHFLNQWMERDNDAKMDRTRNRPLPAGRVKPSDAASIGVFLIFWGTVELYLSFNVWAAGLALLTAVTYVAVYTPLKQLTVLNTWVGALPGATPPLIGWAAAKNGLDWNGMLLFAIVFVWQIPHFLALAWRYRQQYAGAGFRMLPLIDQTGKHTALQIILHSFALLQVSLLPPVFLPGLGIIYYASAMMLGAIFIRKSIKFYFDISDMTAMAVFFHSIIYLPLLLVAMALDYFLG